MTPRTREVIIRNGTLVTPAGLVDADLGVKDEVIDEIGTVAGPGPTIDASDCFVVPGVVDPHVHVPIRGDASMPALIESLRDASRAGLLGGVTTAGVFVRGSEAEPLTEAIEREIEEGERWSAVDFFIHAHLTPGEDVRAAVEGAQALGVTTFKAMQAYRHQGLMLEDEELFRLMREVAAVGGLVLVHPDNGRLAELLESEWPRFDDGETDVLNAVHPGRFEAEGMYRAMAMAEHVGADLLFVHVSAAASVDLIRRHGRGSRGSTVGWETQPHYALLTREEVSRRGALAKVGPPLRSEEDRQAVAEALWSGAISHLSSDHTPRMAAAKLAARDLLTAPYGGISGTELLLPLAHKIVLDSSGKAGIERLVELTSTNAARQFGLYPRKGAIELGSDADLVVLPKQPPLRRITANQLHGRSDFSLYEGVETAGWPRHVVRAGRLAVSDGKVVAPPPARHLRASQRCSTARRDAGVEQRTA